MGEVALSRLGLLCVLLGLLLLEDIVEEMRLRGSKRVRRRGRIVKGPQGQRSRALGQFACRQPSWPCWRGQWPGGCEGSEKGNEEESTRLAHALSVTSAFPHAVDREAVVPLLMHELELHVGLGGRGG